MLESNNTRPWFRDEILRILIGINLSSRVSTTLDKNATDFRRGFTLALASVAIVVGIRSDHIYWIQMIWFCWRRHLVENLGIKSAWLDLSLGNVLDAWMVTGAGFVTGSDIAMYMVFMFQVSQTFPPLFNIQIHCPCDIRNWKCLCWIKPATFLEIFHPISMEYRLAYPHLSRTEEIQIRSATYIQAR